MGHQHSFSMLLTVLRYHKIELCKKWNRREFMLCYQRTAVFPAVMKWFHEEQVRYDGGQGRRRLERRYLRKKKDTKRLFLFIPNLNICCFQHFLNVVFPYISEIADGGWLSLFKWRVFFAVTDEWLLEEKMVSSSESYPCQWTGVGTRLSLRSLPTWPFCAFLSPGWTANNLCIYMQQEN